MRCMIDFLVVIGLVTVLACISIFTLSFLSGYGAPKIEMVYDEKKWDLIESPDTIKSPAVEDNDSVMAAVQHTVQQLNAADGGYHRWTESELLAFYLAYSSDQIETKISQNVLDKLPVHN